MFDDKLCIDIAGIKMKNPIMTASGTCGFGLELVDFVDLNKLGALVVKGTTLDVCLGNPGQRIAETASGMLNCIGLENPGVDSFLTKTLTVLKKFEVPVIVNIAGKTLEEFALLAQKLDVDGISALELNISCPNVKAGGMAYGTCPDMAASVVREVKKVSKKPIITKLSPNVTSITDIALAVQEAGTDAISLINTLLGMSISIKNKKPVLGNVFGGLSGPAVKPVALRMVYQVAKVVNVPIIGMGGIMTANDAIEFMLAGASAVAVGTATFVDPSSVMKITQGLLDYANKEKLDNISQIRGLAL